MTTPQNILHNLEYKLKQLIDLLKGSFHQKGDEEYRDLYELVQSVEIESCELNERMQLLEDKMNLIIKLLSKN